MLGIPASLTKPIDFPSFKSLIIPGIFINELCLLKLMSSFLIEYLLRIFFVCRVSSQVIKKLFKDI